MSMFIVGEAGSNHDGKLEYAVGLCDVAKRAGCDAVKFQLHGSFRPEWIPKLQEHCTEIGIHWFASVFNTESLPLLNENVRYFKIASPEAGNIRLCHDILHYAKDRTVFISDGAIANKPIFEWPIVIPLACVSKYPAEPSDYTLQRYRGQKSAWGVSDHTTSPHFLPSLAVAAGASVIEKHFCLNRRIKTDDSEFSLEPGELTDMVNTIRQAEKVFEGEKVIVPEVRTITWPK